MAKPSVIYYRWVYSPTSGDVDLSHNHEGHPTDLFFHDDMVKDRPEDDLLKGFAYKTDSSWKITDNEHKTTDDPNVVRVVVDAINKREK